MCSLPNKYNVKHSSDVARRFVKAPANLQAVSDEAPARRSFKLYKPSEFTVIEKASTDRTYKVIKTKNGADESMRGALIPEKYDLDHTVAGYPWICPVRSCRKVFKKIFSIGSHFVVGAKFPPVFPPTFLAHHGS